MQKFRPRRFCALHAERAKLLILFDKVKNTAEKDKANCLIIYYEQTEVVGNIK